MIGRKTLSQVRKELESALGQGPSGEGEVAEALRRFLAAGGSRGGRPKSALRRTRQSAAHPGPAEGERSGLARRGGTREG
jgi:uncharacterized Ntn-hydrolase superfamily protein